MSAAAITSSLAFWPGLLLALGGLAKVAEVRGGADENSLPAMLKPGPVPLGAWIGLLAAIELTIGVLVLAGVATPGPEWAAAAMFGAATAAAIWGIWKVPNADCGCFGPRSGRVSWKTITRAGLLSAMAIAAALGGLAWTEMFGGWEAIVLNLIVGAALIALSPEISLGAFQELWREDENNGRPTTVGQAMCLGRMVPIHRHIARLQESPQWRLTEQYMTSTRPSEFWQEGCWRYICFDALYEDRPATAVFAMHLGINKLSRSVVFVDANDQTVLARVEDKRRSPDPLRLLVRGDSAHA